MVRVALVADTEERLDTLSHRLGDDIVAVPALTEARGVIELGGTPPLDAIVVWTGDDELIPAARRLRAEWKRLPLIVVASGATCLAIRSEISMDPLIAAPVQVMGDDNLERLEACVFRVGQAGRLRQKAGAAAERANAVLRAGSGTPLTAQTTRALIDRLPLGIVSVSPGGKVRSANTWALARFGLKEDAPAGRPKLLPDIEAQMQRLQDTGWDGGPGANLVELADEQGNPRHYELTRIDVEPAQPGGDLIMVQDVTERMANSARIEQLAYYDPLTGLANRTLMMDRLRQAAARADRKQSPLHVLFLDLNRFKEINDTQGHAVGDKVLAEVASRFRAALRRSETLARIGGDEFVVVVEDVGEADVIAMIERLQRKLAKPIEIDQRFHSIGVSIGVASYPDDAHEPETLPQLADIAMYDAKMNGGGYRCYNAQMSSTIANRRELAERLAGALGSGDLTLYYQPFVDLKTGTLQGAEALLRWFDPELGQVPTDQFIAIAEERRMMSDIGDWVVGQACRQLDAWRASGHACPPVLAINVAAQQLENDEILACVEDSVRRFGIAPGALELEITESGMMVNPARSADVLSRLKQFGVGLSIDDFGTGYSSLSYLNRFATDKLKIDMSFVRTLLDDPNCHAIVSATIAMAQGLGLTVHAEGVETAAQAARLGSLNCDIAQGYYYGEPLPADAFAQKWLSGLSSEDARAIAKSA